VKRVQTRVFAFGFLLLAVAVAAAFQPAAGSAAGPAARITIDYPAPNSIFPPEFPPPQFEWRDAAPQATAWRIEVTFADGANPLHLSSAGEKMQIGAIDPESVADTNQPPKLTPEQAVGHVWRPDDATWDTIKRHSVRGPARLRFQGFASERGGGPLSAGYVDIHTSTDPVGAPVFYRDVPLIPFEGTHGVINPLPVYAVPLIKWKLRDLSQTSSRLMLANMPTCANCHSFSMDGKTMGLDVDGPKNDKGLYALVPLRPDTVIHEADVIRWNSRGEPAPKRFGFMSQVSPDGKYVVTSMEGRDAQGRPLSDRLYNAGYPYFGFGQVFYPTRGILGWFSRETGKLQPLPGADDPRFVQASAVWNPDGKYLYFLRAEAREPYPAGRPPAKFANDPNETPIQYDLYRIPFNQGRGGQPEPVAGASRNGKSNSFAKVSPDGRWIVFVQARNGLLMRPDSELYIIPAQGGAARRLRCNASPMNSWHSWSPNSRWLVFSSKRRSPYTQMYLTHIDPQGNDSPAILVENTTAANRAVNIPEFVNVSPAQFAKLEVPAARFYGILDHADELTSKGDDAAAIAEWRRALEIEPADDKANYSLGALLMKTGDIRAAIPYFEKALAASPRYPNANGDLGVALAASGRMEEAVPHFELEFEISPGSAEAHSNYARALAQAGRLDDAVAHFRQAAAAAPGDSSVHRNLGRALAIQGHSADAIAELEQAVQLDPRQAAAHQYLGELLFQTPGRTAEALAQWRTALSLQPDQPVILNRIARVLATSPDPALRNGAEAVSLAERAVQLSNGQAPLFIDTLAAAYAEAGRFPEAVATERRALEFAASANNPQITSAVNARIALYQANTPLRESTPGSARR
jgi:tetratricopeptide (TPR) repeat protein